MPVYVYRCDTCGVTFEKKQSIIEGPLTCCPECEGHVRRVYQPVGVVFKGSGWYVTDSRSRNPANGSGSSSDTGEGASTAGESKSDDSKPKPAAAESAAKDS